MKVRELRMQVGLSQSKFADMFEIPVSTLKDWEQERRNPPEYVVKMIERILNQEGKLISQSYIEACERRRKSVENAMAIILSATSGPDEMFLDALDSYIFGKITLEEMEAKIDRFEYFGGECMSGGKNCYPGSDVLVNKYDIRDKELLEKFEIQKVVARLLGLDLKPTRISYTYDSTHLVNIHKYLFGDIYEWAGTFRKENLYKSERVLSGGSAEYADYREIESRLKFLLQEYKGIDWVEEAKNRDMIAEFLLELWSIHPFREGNTRTCITFLWHYLKGKGVDFHVALLRNNPMYVRDSLVMANYDQKEYLQRIISDALCGEEITTDYSVTEKQADEQYKIAKADYEAFREKYSIKKE